VPLASEKHASVEVSISSHWPYCPVYFSWMPGLLD
jgi:hypothetical protein